MNRRILLIILIALLAGFGAFFMTSRKPAPVILPVPTPTPYIGVGFRGLNMDDVTEQTILTKLGKPIREDLYDQDKILVYPSGIGTRAINVSVNATKNVTLIVEPARPGTRWTTLSATLGKEDALLYGHFALSGFALYTYLSKGTAVLANKTTNEVWEQWYFPPTTAALFLESVAIGYSFDPPAEGQE